MEKAEKTRYSDEELKEFEQLIIEKLEKAHSELKYIKESKTKTENIYRKNIVEK